MKINIKRILSFFVIILSVCISCYAKTFLFIGDSITDGNWGSPQGYPCSSDERNKTDLNHVLGHGYVEMIAGEFMGEMPDSNYYFINRGISGETLYQIAARWDKDVMANNPDVISLLCGTNDIHYWLETGPASLEEFDFNSYKITLDSLINQTRRKLPDAEIVLCTPFVGRAGWAASSADFSLRKDGVDSIASIVREVCAAEKSSKVTLVDFNRLLEKLESENPDMAYWIWDGIHPTTAMHHRMAREWIQTEISKVLKIKK